MQDIILIAAAAENDALGQDNDLLWHLPDDFKRFKRLTLGYKIIMGRKTFESFPKPLPKRIHIVITRDRNYSPKFPDCIVVHSLKEALNHVDKGETTYIIGGGEIYQLALEIANKIELTRIHHEFEADTFFPRIDETQWKLVASEYHAKDDRHAYDFTYLSYEKK
ncbi:dihydrofolate reductase [Flavobacteriaceae bacterium 3-367]|uniref:dihydrofolate reductase n=1 Tax=Eudoraea algarum TaxID=3417568 RepID=UPI00326E268C